MTFLLSRITGESAQDSLANMELDKLNTFFKALMPVQSNSIHKPPAQPLRIEKVLPLPGEHTKWI